MEQIENTLQNLKCMLIEDGYKEDNIVLRTLIKAEQQVKNLNIPAVIKSVCENCGKDEAVICQQCYDVESQFRECY